MHPNALILADAAKLISGICPNCGHNRFCVPDSAALFGLHSTFCRVLCLKCFREYAVSENRDVRVSLSVCPEPRLELVYNIYRSATRPAASGALLQIADTPNAI